MNFQIADFITRIKNAAMAHRKKVLLPYSKVTKAIGDILVREGFLTECKEELVDEKKVLHATIRYEKRTPVFTDITIVSKPSLRIYASAKTLPKKSRRGKDVTIISTSYGVMTAEEAMKKGVGGELLLTLW